jgi:hypothetical protein
MKMKKSLFGLLIVLLISNTLMAGGPWTQKKGIGFFKLSEWWVVFDQHFNAEGNIDKNVTTGVFNTSLYAEYGLTDRLTGIFNGNIFSRNYTNNQVSSNTGEIVIPGDELNALGDIDLGLKYGITKAGSKIPVAASLYIGVPTGSTDAGSRNFLNTGDGEFNQMIQLDLGYGFQLHDNVSAYLSGYGGINNRTQSFSDELRYGTELGLGLLKNRIWLVARVYGVSSFNNGDETTTINSANIYANNLEYGSTAIEINGYATKRLGLSFGNATAFHGELIAARPSYSVGIFYDMSK